MEGPEWSSIQAVVPLSNIVDPMDRVGIDIKGFGRPYFAIGYKASSYLCCAAPFPGFG
jgi:hypothetical protein